jgi:hypothetical protein
MHEQSLLHTPRTHTILISPYVAEHYRGKLRGRRTRCNPLTSSSSDRAPRIGGKILFAGRLCERKEQELLQALAAVRTREATPRLAGSLADREYVSVAPGAGAEARNRPQCRVRGSLGGADRARGSPNARSRAAAFQETAPMVVEEAMAAGVPVIASNIAEFRTRSTRARRDSWCRLATSRH